MITTWILFVLTFAIGYYLGGRGKTITQEIQAKIADIMEEKPKPGVVNPLTPEQIEEKHDPIKQGNKSAFDRFFRNFPPPKP